MAKATAKELIAHEIALLTETLHGELADKLAALRDEAAIDAAKRKLRVAKATLEESTDLEVSRSEAYARAMCNLPAEARGKLEAAALIGRAPKATPAPEATPEATSAPAPTPTTRKRSKSKPASTSASAPASAAPEAARVIDCG